MARNEIFWLLLVTVVMVLAGWRERANPPLATLLIAIPVCGWLALYFGK